MEEECWEGKTPQGLMIANWRCCEVFINKTKCNIKVLKEKHSFTPQRTGFCCIQFASFYWPTWSPQYNIFTYKVFLMKSTRTLKLNRTHQICNIVLLFIFIFFRSFGITRYDKKPYRPSDHCRSSVRCKFLWRSHMCEAQFSQRCKWC